MTDCFKVGDRVKCIDKNHFMFGKTGKVTSIFAYKYYKYVLVSFDDLTSLCIWDNQLESIQKRFEVGKKYVNNTSIFSGLIYKCVYVNENQAVLEMLKPFSDFAFVRHDELNTRWKEYIPEPPKPVKKEGWIAMGRDKRIFSSKEALEQHLQSNISEKKYVHLAHVEWEEIPEAKEDDSVI